MRQLIGGLSLVSCWFRDRCVLARAGDVNATLSIQLGSLRQIISYYHHIRITYFVFVVLVIALGRRITAHRLFNQAPLDRFDSFLERVLDLMLPNADDPPSLGRKEAADFFVARKVLENLALPELGVCFRHYPMLWASVPETSIHKNRHLLFWEDNVWFAVKRVLEPVSQPLLPQSFPEFHLWFCVPAPYTRHAAGTLLRGKYVSTFTHCSIAPRAASTVMPIQ